MEAISRDKAIKILHRKKITLFDVSDAKKVFGIRKDNTLYKLLQRLEEADVIRRVIKGKYRFLLGDVDDFELANFLVDPSYVSLESALSFYGILPQFPYTITSATPRRSKTITYQDKEYQFSHLKPGYFFGFEKKENFLIATPEKALLDELYFVSKKLRKVHFEDLGLDQINRKKFKAMLRRFKFQPLRNLIEELDLV